MTDKVGLENYMITYEHFMNTAMFPHLLYTTVATADIQNLMMNLATNTIGGGSPQTTTTTTAEASPQLAPITTTTMIPKSVYDDKLKIFKTYYVDMTTTSQYDTSNTSTAAFVGMFKGIIDGSSTGDSLYSNIVGSYKIPLPAIGPAVKNEVCKQHISTMELMFKVMFYALYKTIQTKTVNNSSQNLSAYASSLDSYDTLTSFNLYVDARLREIYTREVFNTDMDFATYMSSVVNGINDAGFKTRKNPADNTERYLFYIAFYPYFLYRYFSHFVLPSPYADATSKGSRNVYVRRQGILNMYMFQIYMLFSVYVLFARLEPSGEKANAVRMVMDTNAINLFVQESDSMDTEKLTKTLNTATEAALSKTHSMTQTNRDIEMSRNNINKVLNNEPKTNAALKKAIALKWFWMSMLVVYGVFAIAAIALYHLGGENIKKMIPGLVQLVSAIYIVGLSISGMVYVANKF